MQNDPLTIWCHL